MSVLANCASVKMLGVFASETLIVKSSQFWVSLDEGHTLGPCAQELVAWEQKACFESSPCPTCTQSLWDGRLVVHVSLNWFNLVNLA